MSLIRGNRSCYSLSAVLSGRNGKRSSGLGTGAQGARQEQRPPSRAWRGGLGCELGWGAPVVPIVRSFASLQPRRNGDKADCDVGSGQDTRRLRENP